jgi:hypothetical protein
MVVLDQQLTATLHDGITLPCKDFLILVIA